MTLSLLIIYECPNAFHEVCRVLVIVSDNAHALRGVVGSDIFAE